MKGPQRSVHPARLAPLWLCAALLAHPYEARAQGHSPGVWERAADPAWQLSEEVHRKVEALLADAELVRWHSSMGQDQLSKALLMLEEAGADGSPDVRLRFDLGKVTSLLGEEKRAMPALESALREAPNHPLAKSAFFELAICYAKLGNPEAELTAYDEYLRRETDVADRANALSNRAEAQMLQGRMPLAIADYRASLLLQPDNVLAHWGLAVALDRSGDAPGALLSAKAAIAYDPLDQALHRPPEVVFFMPPYDIYWYEGVGAMARAQQQGDPAAAILWWETAVAKWNEYLAFAASDDRWLALAKAHESWCKRQLDEAKKHAPHPSKARRRVVARP